LNPHISHSSNKYPSSIKRYFILAGENEAADNLPSIISNSAGSFLPLFKNLGIPLPLWFLCPSNKL